MTNGDGGQPAIEFAAGGITTDTANLDSTTPFRVIWQAVNQSSTTSSQPFNDRVVIKSATGPARQTMIKSIQLQYLSTVAI